VIPLALLLLLLHLAEIAGRRLFLFAAAETKIRAIHFPKFKLPVRKPPAKPGKPVDSLAVPSEPEQQPAEPAMAPVMTTSPLERAKAKARERIER
jgi:hypothetical protein